MKKLRVLGWKSGVKINMQVTFIKSYREQGVNKGTIGKFNGLRTIDGVPHLRVKLANRTVVVPASSCKIEEKVTA